MSEFIIDDDNFNKAEFHAGNKGCKPRDYSVQPTKKLMRDTNIPLIPRNEWSARIKEMVATKSQLSDIRMRGNFGTMIPSLDQNGQGYCWAYSTTAAVQLLRARANMPYVGLSAHGVACKIKNFRDEGAWGALSMEFAQAAGIPSQAFWPAQSMSRSHDNPATWENAKKHQITSGYVDLDADVWERSLTFDQVATLLLSRIPVVLDYNWWGHSVCGLDLVETSPNNFGVRILNSWGDSWSDRGMGVLVGYKAIPNGAVAPLVTDA